MLTAVWVWFFVIGAIGCHLMWHAVFVGKTEGYEYTNKDLRQFGLGLLLLFVGGTVPLMFFPSLQG